MKLVGTFHYTKHPKYDYVLKSDLNLLSSKYLGNHDYTDEFGRVWVEMRGYSVTIKKEFAWDGASMAPDFKDVVLPSCVHDAFLQAHRAPCFPLSKAEIDSVFRKLMPGRFAFRWIYWGAVRVFGGAYAALAKHDPSSVTCGLPHKK